MNYKALFKILGKVMTVEGILMAVPMIVGFLYGENNYLGFLIPMGILFVVGFPLSIMKNSKKPIRAREGFTAVALSWVLMSVIGALPFVITGEIPNYIDALFETVSGFTTTGATVLDNVEELSQAMLFWRSFTHWIGGMGVLVFILAVVPDYNEGIMHVFRAESPGPSATKFTSKLKFTARILYGIYIAMTLLEFILLLIGGMGLFDSAVHAFSTAGTGGFGIRNDSIAGYSVYTQIVIAVFMFLFGINFNIYYLIILGNFRRAFKSEELRAYIIIVFASVLLITINLFTVSNNFAVSLKDAFFHVTSISSSTGFSTADINTFPVLSQSLLCLLMIIGACGGSTGGGIKVARLIILTKSSASELKKTISPRAITSVKFEGEELDREIIKNTRTYFGLWVIAVAVSTLLLSIENTGNLAMNFTASLSAIGNTGPYFNPLGAAVSYSAFGYSSKIILSLVMLIGRLEIFPMLILFAPKTWKRG